MDPNLGPYQVATTNDVWAPKKVQFGEERTCKTSTTTENAHGRPRIEMRLFVNVALLPTTRKEVQTKDQAKSSSVTNYKKISSNKQRRNVFPF